MRIIYMVHSTTTHNEQGLASGWINVGLSPLGERQAEDLRAIFDLPEPRVVYISDTLRARQTGRIVFPSAHLIEDRRLREQNYGLFNGHPSASLPSLPPNDPFPGGESCKEVEVRVREFLVERAGENREQIVLISHRAPQLAIRVITERIDWSEAITTDWRRIRDFRAYWCYKY
jgi:broad specificity phosphatase PhoE